MARSSQYEAANQPRAHAPRLRSDAYIVGNYLNLDHFLAGLIVIVIGSARWIKEVRHEN